ncbi:hypothetical protein [Streptomyces sp. NPDC048196]|uniref:hypothetical protein n=1 Tax=Streptomyces sp. NPDC048196 TaxID=3154712 RepID=UPI0033ED7357
MTDCEMCGRPLRRPSPDGLGPRCRRKKRAAEPESDRTTTVPGRHWLDHAALAAAGQTAIPIQPAFSDCEPAWRPARRRRRITDVPGPDTWPAPEENSP